MPIERRTRQQQLTGLLIGVALAIFAVTLGYALIRATQRGDFSLKLGDETFVVGNVRTLAPQAADAPMLFSDVSGRGQARPIFVIHDGGVNAEGWAAFLAVAPGTDDCYLEWDTNRELFTAECTDETFDRDGTGLTHYPWSVDDDDNLVVDLRSDSDANAATTTGPAD